MQRGQGASVGSEEMGSSVMDILKVIEEIGGCAVGDTVLVTDLR